MEVQPDFRDLCKLFNEHKVKFLIVGGYALAFHGAPRFTGDIDFFVESDKINAEKIVAALAEFGFKSSNLNIKDFQNPHKVIQLGVPPVRIDIITSITGVSWEDAYESREKGKYGDIEVYFLGRAKFIENKQASSRKKDLADIEALGEE